MVTGIGDLGQGVGRVEEAQWETRDAVLQSTDVTRRGFRRVDHRLEDLYWAVGTSAEMNARGQDRIVRELQGGFGLLSGHLGNISSGLVDIKDVLWQIEDNTEGLLWATENGFVMLAEGQQQIADILVDGFDTLAQEFHWGFARLAHQMELNREVYLKTLSAVRALLDAVRHPRKTAAREFREDADRALRNGWWDRAVANLQGGTENWHEDFLTHYDLARVLWFQYGRWEEGMEHFRHAATYGGERGASKEQRYYAALACLHGSLLWRMDADTHPKQFQESSDRAYNATHRAMQLRPDILLPRVEHTVNCLRAGAVEEGFRLLEEDARANPRRLNSYLVNPELKAFPQVALKIHRLRRKQHSTSARSEATVRLTKAAAIAEQQADTNRVASAAQQQTLAAEARAAAVTSVSPIQGRGAIKAVLFHPRNARLLLVAVGGNYIGLWNLDSRDEVRAYTGANGDITDIAFSPTGTRFVAAISKLLDGSSHDAYHFLMQNWDAEKSKIQQISCYARCTLPPAYNCISFSRGGSILAYGSQEAVELRNSRNGEPLGKVLVHRSDWGTVLFNNDDSILVTNHGAVAGLWKLKHEVSAVSTKQLRELKCQAIIRAIALSHDGKILACGLYDDGRIVLWSMETGDELRSFQAHDYRGVTSLAFSPDGLLLASAGGNGQISLWEVAIGRKLRTLKEQGGGGINTIAFAPDGKALAGGDEDGVIHLWQFPSS